MIDAYPTTSCREAVEIVGRYESDAAMHLAVLRGENLLEFTLQAGEAPGSKQEAPLEEK
jgi:hypothetical protein